jgi:hypothetical protein
MERDSRMVETAPAEQVSHDQQRLLKWFATVVSLSSVASSERQNVVVEWLTHLLRIRDVPGSNLGTETSYPELNFVVFLSPSRQIPG